MKKRKAPCAQCEKKPAREGKLAGVFCSADCAITSALIYLDCHTIWCEAGWHWFSGSQGDDCMNHPGQVAE